MPKKFSWNQSCCERCWADEIGWRTDPETGIGRLIEPVRRLSPEDTSAKVCAFCGNPTWVGIFVRRDPQTVPYPTEETE